MEVIAVGLNPSLDHTLFVERLVPGRIHRTGRCHVTAGGKAVNAARAARALGALSAAAGPVGGPSGRHLVGLAEREGLEGRWYEIAGSTRMCTLLVADSGEETVVNEEGPTLRPDEWTGLLALLVRVLPGSGAVVLSGSLPGGVPVDAYRTLLARAGEIPVVLDARGPELLEALAARPAWIHLTRDELALTFARRFESEADHLVALGELLTNGARRIVLTDGPGPVLVATLSEAWRVHPPAVEAAHTIGCGDALAAALAVSFRTSPEADPVFHAVRAVAAASASAETPVPGALDRARADSLLSTVAAERVD